jgi:hypothetical protein
MKPRFIVCAIVSVGSLFAGSAVAKTAESGLTACYEVIAPQPNALPRTPLLVDKCSGRTWLLTKSARGAGYRWARVSTEEAAPSSGAAQAKAPEQPANSRNCFTFNNRRFCE